MAENKIMYHESLVGLSSITNPEFVEASYNIIGMPVPTYMYMYVNQSMQNGTTTLVPRVLPLV